MSPISCCRTCLCDTSLNPIFETIEQHEQYTTIIHSITGISVDKEDVLPKMMCSDCINFINKSQIFRENCQKTQQILERGRNEGVVYESNVPSYVQNDSRPYNYISISITSNCKENLINNDCDSTEDSNWVPIAENGSVKNERKSEPRVKKRETVKRSKRRTDGKYKKKNLVNTNGIKSCDVTDKKLKKKPYGEVECDVCLKSIKINGYKNHYKKHTGFDVVCEHCGKAFVSRRKLLAHCKAKHGYEKTDKCSFCDYTASNIELVKIHERLHTGEKPYTCKICGAGFHRNSNYLQHLPIHLPEKTVQCDQCPAMFKSVTLMRIHKNTRHKASKYQYKCSICQNTFVRRYNVIKHLRRIHSLIGKDECSLCPSAFKSIRFLRTHYNKKHKQKKYTYTCHICKNYFKTTGNVRMHLFRIHGIPKEEQGPVHRVSIANSYLM